MFFIIQVISIVITIITLIYYARFISHFRAAKRRGERDFLPSWLNPVLFSAGVGCLLISLNAFMFANMHFAARSKAYEAKFELGAIFTSQIAYFGENNLYAGGEEAFQDIGWMPEGNPRYSYYLGKDEIMTKRDEPIKFSPKSNWPFSSKPAGTNDSFLVFAIGNNDLDECPDVWTINENKELIHLVDDTRDHYKPGQCKNCPWAKEQSGMSLFLEEHEMLRGFTSIWVTFLIAIIVLPISIYRIKKDKKKMKALQG